MMGKRINKKGAIKTISRKKKKKKDKLVLDFICREVNWSIVRESTLYFSDHIFAYKS